jgi:hypothetical protein
MATTSPAKVRNVTALVCAVLVATIISIGSYFKNAPAEDAMQIKADSIAEFVVDEMPDSPLRNNLMTVFGAEYAGSSEELNEVLRAYAKMKVQELNKGL